MKKVLLLSMMAGIALASCSDNGENLLRLSPRHHH